MHWYNRDLKSGEAARLEEIRKIKEAEEDALAVALSVSSSILRLLLIIPHRGFEPAARPAPGTQPGPSAVEGVDSKTLGDAAMLAAKEEKRRRKEERRKRKEEKREQKELKRARRLDKGIERDGRRIEADGDDDHAARRWYPERSRSRSPRRANQSRGRSSSRSPSYDGDGYHSRYPRDVIIHRLDERLRTEDRKVWRDRDYRRDLSTDRW